MDPLRLQDNLNRGNRVHCSHIFGFAHVANIKCIVLVSRERGSRKANSIRIMAKMKTKNEEKKKVPMRQ